MGKVRVKDVEVAYHIHGSGEPLILIGGFTMTKEAWSLQIAGLEKRFKVLSFDNRGVGETVYPPGPFTVEEMAADTVGLMDAVGMNSAHVFGVSMGGLIAQILLLDYPDRVKRATLGCTTHGGRHAIQPQPEVMATLARAADPSLAPADAIRMRIPVIFGKRFIKEEPDKVEEFVRASLKHWPTPEGAGGQIKALSTFNVKRRLGEIQHPVLVVTGSEDRMMPPENSRLLAEGIQGAQLHMVEGAGHAFHQERPDEVNRVLTEFFLESK
jgi:pimeloyl-ACP methyl ester carboxylesterase